MALSAASPSPADFSALAAPGRHEASLPIAGETRTFIFYTPPAIAAGRPLPLVFFFHGAGGSATQAARTYGWIEKAETEGFFVVFSDGLPFRKNQPPSPVLNPRIWRDQRASASGIHRSEEDLDFFRILLDRIEAALPVDPRRIYLAGFSNGAAMTFTLGALHADRIAAIAPVCSQSFAPAERLARPLPVYYLVGTADPLIPFAGDTSRLPWGTERNLPPVWESVEQWARLDGCPAQPQTVPDLPGVAVRRYGPGAGGAEILHTVVEGNGHHWPGTTEPLPRAISGPRVDSFRATDRIWDFFAAHPLK